MKLSHPLILASQSPRRKELMSYSGYEFDIVVADVDETPDESLEYLSWAQDIALRKAQAIIDRGSDQHIVLAADTMVFLDGLSYAKPSDHQDAARMLKDLAGRSHEVITGVAIVNPHTTACFSVKTIVHLDAMTEDEIDFYIREFKPMDKAGAYGIQDWMGICKVRRLEGSYTNVMGLPMAEVMEALNCSFSILDA